MSARMFNHHGPAQALQARASELALALGRAIQPAAGEPRRQARLQRAQTRAALATEVVAAAREAEHAAQQQTGAPAASADASWVERLTAHVARGGRLLIVGPHAGSQIVSAELVYCAVLTQLRGQDSAPGSPLPEASRIDLMETLGVIWSHDALLVYGAAIWGEAVAIAAKLPGVLVDEVKALYGRKGFAYLPGDDRAISVTLDDALIYIDAGALVREAEDALSKDR